MRDIYYSLFRSCNHVLAPVRDESETARAKPGKTTVSFVIFGASEVTATMEPMLLRRARTKQWREIPTRGITAHQSTSAVARSIAVFAEAMQDGDCQKDRNGFAFFRGGHKLTDSAK